MAELVEPIVPTGLAGTDAFLKGFSLVAGINQRNRELQLEVQRMAQEEGLKQQQFQLARAQMDQDAKLSKDKLDFEFKKLEQDKPLYDAETDSYKAQAELRRAQKQAFDQGVGNAAQRKATEQKRAGEMGKELGEIQAPIGSSQWQHEATLISNKYSDIQGTPEYRSVWSSHLLENNRAAIQARLNQGALLKNFGAIVNQLGVSPDAFSDPYMWGNAKQDKSGKLVDTGGSDADYKYVLVDKANHVIPPRSDFQNFQQEGIRMLKLDKNRWKAARDMHEHIQDIITKNHLAPSPTDVLQMPDMNPVNTGQNTTYILDDNGELKPAQ